LSRPSTKQRITQTTLALFNEFGVANISTNHIALELDISPGNLYYHYPNKEALIETLFSAYEVELHPLLTQTFSEQLTIEDIWFFLHFSFELALRYRFIYQDTDYVVSKSPSLAPKFRRILEKLREALIAILKALSAAGVLTTSSETLIKDLTLNMLIVCTQWIGFKHHLSGSTETSLSDNDLSQGVYQVLSLLLPYLDQDNQVHLCALRQEYK
jgi:AcrR family transcriptional regulator